MWLLDFHLRGILTHIRKCASDVRKMTQCFGFPAWLISGLKLLVLGFVGFFFIKRSSFAFKNISSAMFIKSRLAFV